MCFLCKCVYVSLFSLEVFPPEDWGFLGEYRIWGADLLADLALGYVVQSEPFVGYRPTYQTGEALP